jgi:hypothetical protein
VKVATAFLVLLAAAAAGVSAGGATHFDVQATFVPPSKGAEAAVAVLFTPKDPDVKINETPAPKLRLDGSQSVLTEKAPASVKASEASEAPGSPRYLDLSAPVRFPVGLGPAAVKGTHLVKASLAYFYCSKREGWCRKGTTELEIPVLLR